MSENGLVAFHYALEVWVKDGIIQPCEHLSHEMISSCNARKYAGRALADVLAERGR